MESCQLMAAVHECVWRMLKNSGWKLALLTVSLESQQRLTAHSYTTNEIHYDVYLYARCSDGAIITIYCNILLWRLRSDGGKSIMKVQDFEMLFNFMISKRFPSLVGRAHREPNRQAERRWCQWWYGDTARVEAIRRESWASRITISNLLLLLFFPSCLPQCSFFSCFDARTITEESTH